MSRTRKPAVDAELSSYWQQAVAARRGFELGLLVGVSAATSSSNSSSDALLTAVPVPPESGACTCRHTTTSPPTNTLSAVWQRTATRAASRTCPWTGRKSSPSRYESECVYSLRIVTSPH